MDQNPNTNPNLNRKGRYDSDRLGYVCPGSNYSADEIEFLKAVEDFKKKRKVIFPTHTQVLHILLSLGYRKVVVEDATDATNQSNESASIGDQPQ